VKHSDVGSFLRARREALRPADVGLVPGGRRRTPGLRRAEVALLADVSVDYYERLEQSRNAHPSQQLLASPARALRLSVDERAGNVTWRWFTDPASREHNVPAEHERIGRSYAADLRTAAAQRGRDAACDRLIADLTEASEEFRRYWEAMEVAPLRSTRKTLVHQRAGRLDVQCDVVLSAGTGQRLVIFRPQPGSATADGFAFLDVLGEQTFEA
jgi:transcriptional regulator with XRE-family HTH domain